MHAGHRGRKRLLVDIILVLILLALLGLGGWFVIRAASGGGRKH